METESLEETKPFLRYELSRHLREFGALIAELRYIDLALDYSSSSTMFGPR